MQVVDIYRRYEAIAGESAMKYGPAHCTWADENFDSADADLRDFDRWVEEWNHKRDFPSTPEELAAVRQSLEELLALPEGIRCAMPDDYDDEHPDLYPPAADLVMEHGV